MKKFICFLLVVSMVFGMTSTAFASEEASLSGNEMMEASDRSESLSGNNVNKASEETGSLSGNGIDEDFKAPASLSRNEIEEIADDTDSLSGNKIRSLAADTAAVSTAITRDTKWKYLDNNTDPAGDSASVDYERTSWAQAGFDDSEWSTGSGAFGSAAEVNGVKAETVLKGCTGSNNTPAYFFRTSFDIADADYDSITKLVGTIEYDDAVIVYVNGTKVFERNNVLTEDNAGITVVDGSEITANLQYAGIYSAKPANGSKDKEILANEPHQRGETMIITDSSVWKKGENTVAVEVHNASATDSDVWFDMSLAPCDDTQETIGEFSVWSYLDNNTDPAGDSNASDYNRTIWTAEDYNDSGWKTGAGPFGSRWNSYIMANSNPKEVVGTLLEGILYKTEGIDNTPAYFFRTKLYIEDLSALSALKGTVTYDDSVVVYINGQEVFRENITTELTKNLMYNGDNYGSTPPVKTFTVSDTSILNEGYNTIAVEVHEYGKSGGDILMDLQLAPSYSAVAAAKQSNISLAPGADQTQMNVAWHCDTADTGKLLLAEKRELVDGRMPETAVSFTASVVANNDNKYTNKVTVTGLKAGGTYAYQLVNGTTVSDISSFTVDDGDQFSFAFVADPQIGYGGAVDANKAGWAATLKKVEENMADVSFLLTAGDQVQLASNEEQYDAYLDQTLLRSLPVATVIGNHDTASPAYGQHFHAPNESDQYGVTAAGGDSCFVYNNVLFMVLNTNDLSASEHEAFMRQAMAENPNAAWKVVALHHSIYSVAMHASEDAILSRRNELAPLFDELGIDVVLMGHDHVYVRSYIMDGLQAVTDAAKYDNTAYSSITDPEGVLYVTANSGSGSKYYDITGTYPYAAVQNQEKVPNVSRVTVSDSTFTITTYRTTDMSVVDTFTINHTEAGKDDTLEEIVVSDRISEDTKWKYLDNNTDPAGDNTDAEYHRTAWTEETFDDSLWKTGTGAFGSAYTVNDVAANTRLKGCTGSENYSTYFFRTAFHIDEADVDSVQKLAGTIEYDDAVIVYVNGKKVFERNITDTLNQNLMYTGEDNGHQRGEPIIITDKVWKAGENTVAVEVHKCSDQDDDVWFHMTLAPHRGRQEVLDRFSVWNYLDNNTDPAGDSSKEGYNRTSWTAENYNDSSWKTGVGPFGSRWGSYIMVNNSPKEVVGTLLDGINKTNNTPAFFFRTELYIEKEDLEDITSLTGHIAYDDSVVIYINGVEVYRGNITKDLTENLMYNGINNTAPNTVELLIDNVSMLHEGSNTVAVELHESRAEGGDIWVDLELAPSFEKIEYQSDITLSIGTYESEMNFNWYYKDSTAGQVLLAKASELTEGKMPQTAACFAATAKLAYDGHYSNKAAATGLEKGTTYAYQLVNGKDTSEIYTFTTDDGDAFSFAYVADPQIGVSAVSKDTGLWADVLKQVEQNKNFSDISFMLSAGDQVDTASKSAETELEYGGLFNHDLLRSLPLVSVIGNHDNTVLYDEHHNLPNESEQYGVTNNTGDYYFVYNKALFMVLNSNDTSAAEHKAFMEAVIKATENQDIQWKIVSLHHSFYSTVLKHGIDNQMDRQNLRKKLVPVFEALDIDVVLMGHDHVYCRTYMMKGVDTVETDANYTYGNGTDKAPTAVTDPEGILYVSANSGSGSKYNDLGTAENPYAAVQNQEKVPNVSLVKVSEAEFAIITYRTTDMSVMDTFTICRTIEDNTPGGGDDGTTDDGTTDDGTTDDGTTDDGTTDDGTTDDGTTDDGTAGGGETNDGTTDEGTGGNSSANSGTGSSVTTGSKAETGSDAGTQVSRVAESPETGDAFQPFLWAALIAVSCGAAVGILAVRKRKRG